MPSVILAVLLFGEPLASQESSPQRSRGDELVTQALQSFQDQPSLEAKVRQRATMFGQRVSGAGFFLQLRDGDRTLLRYEFKIQSGNQSSSLLHVNDGRTLWMRRDKGDLKSQSYVSILRLRQLATEKNIDAGVLDLSSALALGGFSEVLRNISENFQFEDPRSVELSGLAMWEVVGRWKPQRTTPLSGNASDPQALPAHLPDTVKLLLGRDQKYPLFPYRIMYGRSREQDLIGRKGPSNAVIDPLVTVELFEVRRRPDLTPADFAFQPSDENVENRTDEYAQKLGLNRSAEK